MKKLFTKDAVKALGEETVEALNIFEQAKAKLSDISERAQVQMGLIATTREEIKNEYLSKEASLQSQATYLEELVKTNKKTVQNIEALVG